MSPRSRTLVFTLGGLVLLVSGCSTLPAGYTASQWAALSPAEQRRVQRSEWDSSDAMHRALARDAATENGFRHNSAYGPW